MTWLDDSDTAWNDMSTGGKVLKIFLLLNILPPFGTIPTLALFAAVHWHWIE